MATVTDNLILRSGAADAYSPQLEVSALVFHNDTTAQAVTLTNNEATPKNIMTLGLTDDGTPGDTYMVSFAKPWVVRKGIRIATADVTVSIFVA